MNKIIFVFPVIILIIFGIFLLPEKKEIIIEAESMHVRNGYVSDGQVTFYQDGFAIKNVNIPSSWVGKNLNLFLIAKADPFPLSNPRSVNYYYNVTVYFPLTLNEIINSKNTTEPLPIEMELKQDDGLERRRIYTPTPSYTEMKQYISEHQEYAFRLAKEKSVLYNTSTEQGRVNMSIIGIDFNSKSIAIQFHAEGYTYPEPAIVHVAINDSAIGRIAVNEDVWNEHSLKLPFIAGSDNFALEIDFLNDASVQLKSSDSDITFDRNLYVDKIIINLAE